MSYYDVIERRLHNMKIFMFCIMTLVDGNTMIYQYSETFNSKFACQTKRASKQHMRVTQAKK